MGTTEMPPREAEAQSFIDERKTPRCGRCKGTLQHPDQVRCPYVRCRAWLRDSTELRPTDGKRGGLKGDHA